MCEDKKVFPCDKIIDERVASAQERCIYSLKGSDVAKFKSREHIIPRSIGGSLKLPAGYVSDEVNNIFSGWERSFVHAFPLISVEKMFVGPQGRKGHKQAGISFIRSLQTGQYNLGYISLGKPHLISQLAWNMNDDDINHIQAVLDSVDGQTEKEQQLEKINQLWKYISNYNGYICVVSSEANPEHIMLVGINDKQLYLGVNNSFDEDRAKIEFSNIQNRIRKSKIAMDTIESRIESSQVAYEASVSFGLHDIYRVYAKIAFNCFSIFKGQEYVLDQRFDTLRNSILTGDGIDQYVSFLNRNNETEKWLEFVSNMVEALSLNPDIHLIVFKSEGKRLLADIYLYGFNTSVGVKLDDNYSGERVFGAYCCDWKNKDESFLWRNQHEFENFILKNIKLDKLQDIIDEHMNRDN